jgi:hypothetical protein
MFVGDYPRQSRLLRHIKDNRCRAPHLQSSCCRSMAQQDSRIDRPAKVHQRIGRYLSHHNRPAAATPSVQVGKICHDNFTKQFHFLFPPRTSYHHPNNHCTQHRRTGAGSLFSNMAISKRSAKSFAKPAAAVKTNSNAIPTPFTTAPAALQPLLPQLDPARVHLVHIDRHTPEHKKQIVCPQRTALKPFPKS